MNQSPDNAATEAQHMRWHSWLYPALQAKTDLARGGTGVFASAHITKGTLLAILGGHVMRVAEEPTFSDGRKDLAVQIHDEFVLGAKFPDEIDPTDSINHSCSPNAGFRGQIFLVALRDIEVGQQVCFDYAMALNTANYCFTCHCGSPNCRRIITGEDWKIPALRRHYAGYFQWYLQEKIASLNRDQKEL